MNDRQIRALAKEAEAAAIRYKTELQARTKGTQAGHAVTTSDNHTQPIKSSKGGAVTGSLGEIGGGGMNWETK